MQFSRDRRYLDIFGRQCVSMECIEFSLDSKISKVVDAGHKKPWCCIETERGMFVAGLLAPPLRHLESRTQGEQNQRPDLIQRCLALIWPFYWLKDWMIQIWSRLLCNMWRLWLYESCSFQFKECADVCQTKLSEVTGRRRRRARAEFEKARRSLFLMQRNLKIFEADAF